MNRAHQPAKLHASHDVLHTFERFVGAGAVVQQQKNSRADLDSKQEERDAAEEVPVGKSVDGNGLFFQGTNEIGPVKSLIKPVLDGGEQAQLRPPASG